MSFDNTIDFKDHIVQYPNRFKQTTVAPGVVELVPTWITNSDEVIEPGTPVDSELFKKLKQNVTIYQQTFITTENQTVINLNRDFLVGQNRVSLSIGGVRQYAGHDYKETDSHTLTMTTPLKSGLKAEVIMFTASQAIAEDFFEKTVAAVDATLAANNAAQWANEAAETAYTVQLTPVANFAAIATTYPFAVNGSEVQTLDDGKIYRKENGSWIYRRELTPGPVANVLNKLELQKYYVNVKEFGAKGDGSTDDTQAFKNALLSSRNIRVPISSAPYLVSDTLVLPEYTTILLDGAPTDYTVLNGNVAALRMTANKPLFDMNTGCIVKGGRCEVASSSYSSSLLVVDYSTRRLANILIDTTLKGFVTSGSVAVLFKGNGNGGSLYQIDIKGCIHEFETGIKTDKTSGDSWATGGRLDAKITNCKQAINANTVFGGGVIGGSIQPILKGGSYANTILPLIYLKNIGNFDFTAMLWDLSQAINLYGLELEKCDFFEIPSKIDPTYVKNSSIRNMRKLNPIEPPRQAATYFDSMTGNDENILFGAHEKFTVTITASANVSIINSNSNYERNGMFKLAGKPTYMILNNVSEEWVTIQIDFDIPKSVSLLGFVPKSEPIPRPKSFKISTKRDTDTNFILRKEGNTADLIYSGGNVSETAIHTILPFDQRTNVISLKFEFLLEQNRFATIDSLFAKGNGHSDSYLPKHGGTVFGDIEFVKGGVILKSPNGLVKKRLGIDNSGNFTLTTL